MISEASALNECGKRANCDENRRKMKGDGKSSPPFATTAVEVLTEVRSARSERGA
jgi:hypothetical protein